MKQDSVRRSDLRSPGSAQQLQAIVIREDSTPTDLWHVWYRFIDEEFYSSRLATFYAEAPALIYADRFNREQATR